MLVSLTGSDGGVCVCVCIYIYIYIYILYILYIYIGALKSPGKLKNFL